MDGVNVVELTIVVVLFLVVTVLGFVAARWRRAESLMHLDEWDRYRYVAEFYRVLRPGGRVYFDNFDLRSPDGWVLFQEMAALDVAVRPPNVSKASTEQELTWYAEKAGFSNVASETGQLWITVTARRL